MKPWVPNGAYASDYTDPEGHEFELINGRLLPRRYVMPDGKIYVVQKIRGEKKLVSFGNSPFEPLSVYRKTHFSRKQKRAFMRLKSGFLLSTRKDEHGKQKERVCFMTLSTQYGIKRDRFGKRMVDLNGRSIPENPAQRQEKIKQMNYAFTKIKQQIEYYLHMRMYIRACKKTHRKPFVAVGVRKSKKIKYSKKALGCDRKTCAGCTRFCVNRFRFKLKYFKLKTDEGGGVLHIIFRKGYNVPRIPFAWLSEQWNKIWGSPRVNISQVAVENAQKMSFYMVGQYMQKQPIIRMSYGRQWVFEGMKKSFLHIVDVYGWKRGIEVWNKQLEKGFLPLSGVGRQSRLRWRKYAWGSCCRFPQKGIVGAEYTKTVQTLVDSPKYIQTVDGLNMVYTIFTKRRMKSQPKLPFWNRQIENPLDAVYSKTSRYRFDPQKEDFVQWEAPYKDVYKRWRLEHGYE
ncbi:MAG: hypothetical protein NWF00_00415 [Candidatus Bathyarchaeota archaeon]|nr:hypothetical protein [Candidatus Bathyarchaeota archaeon]